MIDILGSILRAKRAAAGLYPPEGAGMELSKLGEIAAVGIWPETGIVGECV